MNKPFTLSPDDDRALQAAIRDSKTTDRAKDAIKILRALAKPHASYRSVADTLQVSFREISLAVRTFASKGLPGLLAMKRRVGRPGHPAELRQRARELAAQGSPPLTLAALAAQVGVARSVVAEWLEGVERPNSCRRRRSP